MIWFVIGHLLSIFVPMFHFINKGDEEAANRWMSMHFVVGIFIIPFYIAWANGSL